MRKPILLTANTSWYLYNFRESLTRELIQKHFEVAAASPCDEYTERLNEIGIEHFPWSVGRKTLFPTSEFRSILSLRRIIQECAPILVHNHTLKAILFGSLAARKLDVPVVNSVAGRGYIYSSDSLQARVLRPFVNMMLKFSLKLESQMTIFENSTDRSFFIENGLVDPNQTVLIRSVGVDTKSFPPNPLPDSENFIVGYVGRLLWSKGIGTIVESARILKSKGVKVSFVLIGQPDSDNPESIPLEQIKRWEADGLVAYWGWLEDMAEAYSRIHALALPTKYAEGVPTVLLEASSCERAVIASDTPGCREVITDGSNGFLIPNDNPQILAERVLHLANHPEEYNRIRFHAREHVKSYFSKKSVNLATIAVYEKLLEKDFFPGDQH